MENPYQYEGCQDAYDRIGKMSSIAPADPPAFPYGAFPSKSRGTPLGKARSGAKKRTMDFSGKTPAMIANEIFKGITDRYVEVGTGFKCTITIDNREFEGIAQNKKNAKHAACAIAIRSLRPDINLSPNDDFASDSTACGQQTTFGEPSVQATPKTSQPPTKKAKRSVPPPAGPSNLFDLLMKYCTSQGCAAPILDLIDVTPPPITEIKSEDIKGPQTFPDKKKPQVEHYKATLSFPDKGEVFEFTGEGKIHPRELASRAALKKVFRVSDQDIIAVLRKAFMQRLEKINSVYQGMRQMCELACYKLEGVEFEEKVGTRKMTDFVAICNIVDADGKRTEVRGPAAESKMKARDRVAAAALSQIFQIHPACLDGSPNEQAGILPVSQLTQIVQKSKPPKTLSFVDLCTSTPLPGQEFRYKCIIAGTEFFGSGMSKKEAKHDSARVALENMFKMRVAVHREEGGSGDPEASLCESTSVYVRHQYAQMCDFYQIQKSTNFASFLLLNEKNERRIISLGSAQQTSAESAEAAAQPGKHIHHMHSVVLARRGFLRYLIKQLARVGEPDCPLELNEEDGLLRLRTGYRLIIFSSLPIDIRFSSPEAKEQSLSVYGEANLIERAPRFPPVLEEITTSFTQLKVHTVADKIFKWTHLGVQGALLTSRVHPILPCAIYTGSHCPLSDASYHSAFVARLAPSPLPVSVLSHDIDIPLTNSPPHLWSRSSEEFEVLCGRTGQKAEGGVSQCAKESLFSLYLETARGVLPPELSYAEAKASAGGYASSRSLLYQHLLASGLGAWCQKPGHFDSFYVPSLPSTVASLPSTK